MQLQAHHAYSAFAPAALALDPAEFIYAHAFDPVTKYAERVARAFGAAVHVRALVGKDAKRREKVFEGAGSAGRYG